LRKKTLPPLPLTISGHLLSLVALQLLYINLSLFSALTAALL